MDSLEQQWIDGKMIMNGLTNAWMNAMNGWMNEQMMEWALKNKDFRTPICRACIVEIHLQPFNLTFD